MQPATSRQKEILALARVEGRVSVDGLAERFDVTPQTIRKDLNDLCEQRLLAKIVEVLASRRCSAESTAAP
ncbi:MAG: DeoR/GlpR transcriptional regulator [Reyranella sp.]|nr:DeoR/GlpR transcriptional regulator [Reyranella sp.]